ncbi:substrate-binding domain-containing protein [Nocardioides conyzicola]|uniref:Phosphate ABC transporter substrate-binding protein PstS n=1 Tax=Nocardioides conyzicola TaxID=1651781 RepID=A0ABP8XN31_9ACTN
MKLRPRVSRIVTAAAVLGLTMLVPAAAVPPANAATHALIQGSGSSWAANAINQWVADVANQGMQVVFTANGAAQGRKDYANRSNDFGVSDIPFRGADPTTGQEDSPRGRSFAYLPIAAGGTSFPYHVEVAGKLVRNIRLSGETIAKIFTSQITNWNDKQITSDNNGKALPSIPIIPVVHSEGAGVTNQFTRYLAKQYPAIWGPCNGGKVVETEYFPLNCGKSTGNQKAQAGSDGVMNFIKSAGANGSIGIEEYSYPLLADFPAIKLLNKAGYYTLPTQYNVAVALTKAVIDTNPKSPTYLTQNLDQVYVNPDKRTYALSSYVYAIIPTASDDSRMTTAKRQTLADFLYFSICQGQSEIGPIGYSSLPVNLVTAGFDQIGKLKTADSKVDLTKRDVSTCHNPTFIAGKPNVNHLAQIAPNPPACDKVGADPCVAGVGSYNGDNPTDDKNNQPSGNGSGGGAGGAGGGSGAGPGGTDGGGATGVSSDLGLGGTGTTGSSDDPATAGGDIVPTTLAAGSGSGPTSTLTVLVIALLALAVILPAVVSRLLSRRPGGGSR